MKPHLLRPVFWSLCLPVGLFALSACRDSAPRLPEKMPLHSDWTFRQADTGQWLPAKVPGTVHHDLLRHGLIPDPFVGTNEDSVQWVEKKDWEYRCSFALDEKRLARQGQELVFEGLDTYADIYLNDTILGSADNMFRTWRFPVKDRLRLGENSLRVVFRSPIEAVDSAWKALGYELPGGVRTMARKAAFHYGWDWGPRLVTSGIWRSVHLESWDAARLSDWHVQFHEVGKDTAFLTAHAVVRSFDGDRKVKLKLWRDAFFDGKIWTDGEDQLLGETEATLREGDNRISVNGNIASPQLWWCSGLGAPNLYRLRLEVLDEYPRQIDISEKSIGLRKIELVHDEDEHGKSFYFRLNGLPVFAKGANYIPRHSLQSGTTEEDCERLLQDAAAVNMNMLRVWGGGIYEEDYFYRRCDEMGLLVWQDFMFACAMYPGEGPFLENVRQEASDNVRRLRDHPCIALWCGNNENSEAWHNWGWRDPLTPPQVEKVWADYQKLHYEVLRPVVEEHGGGVRFWESSPLYGRAEQRSFTHGDAHYWGVWHDGEPFETYAQRVPRFMSEFGFQSFPDLHTIASYADSAERSLTSPVMMAHQKHPRGNQLIRSYMEKYYQPAKDFSGFVYLSQMLQAEGICAGIEAHRRSRPYCMGTLYWQLNDCWPVASWSGRDFYGRWKALHYRLKDAFSPTLLSAVQENGRLRLFGIQDPLADLSATLTVEAMDFHGKIIFSEKKEVALPAASSSVVWERPLAEMGIGESEKRRTFVRFRLTNAAGNELSVRFFYWEKTKLLQLPVQECTAEVLPAENGLFPVKINARSLQRGVALQAEVPGRWSDNFFEMAPGETRTVYFTPEKNIAQLTVPRIRTLNGETLVSHPRCGNCGADGRLRR